MEIVLVPAWRRADFLLATLKRLLLAWDENLELWICLDRGASTDVRTVARDHVATHGGRMREVAHRYRGNSFNVLTAYLEAHGQRPLPELIHLVEEDIFVARDYFVYHRAAHALCPDAFCVSAVRNHNATDPVSVDSTAVYLHASYQSLGVSWRPRQLARVILHARAAYFSDPVTYCWLVFPEYVHGHDFAEQDGLIRRVLEMCGGRMVFPVVPRAYHAGFEGYNRRGQPVRGMDVNTRARMLLAMDDAALNAHARSHPDHQVVALDVPREAVNHVL